MEVNAMEKENENNIPTETDPTIMQNTSENEPNNTNNTNPPPTPEKSKKATQGHKTEAIKPVESKYSVNDLMAVSRKRFKVPPEVVYAAFKVAKKDKATISEAIEIINKFKERKIK
jgi:hypothetical protein